MDVQRSGGPERRRLRGGCQREAKWTVQRLQCKGMSFS